ncbi:MAG TPA: chemotaxis protein CheB, partial [Blastocatellia bacterium]|nr:chemotaxis protein CheB [Blastocatellia bacterium]
MADTGAKNKRPRRNGRNGNNKMNVVGIGASAGGINALEQLFERLPSDSGMAFVVIIHLSPEHESNLSGMIQRKTEMPVIKVVESVKVEPNHVYVIPPAKHLVITDGHISLREPEVERGRRIPIDTFFRTLAAAYHVKAIGVVLSGTGTDGTLGLRHIKEAGGVSIAQDPQEAEYDGMPRNAINSGMVDFIMPISDMPKKLISLRKISERIQTPPETGKPLTENDDEALREVLLLLRTHTGNDFSNYKKSTVLRRVTRRLQVNAVEDLRGYVALLRERPSEARDLLSDMIISVTNFFRDAEAFAVLEAEVVPRLFEEKSAGERVRVWVAGCATGEEAYSLAILLLDYAHKLKDPPPIQVFATDIDQEAVNEAREGIFPDSIAADVPPQMLKRYFNKEDHFYRVKKEVRELVLFAPHNILRDPPFSKLDLVSCRNLLIYLNRETQERVLELFHFAIRPYGYLFLGASESADSLPELFMPVDKKRRVFRRRSVISSTPYLPSMPVRGMWDPKLPEVLKGVRKPTSYGDLHHQAVEKYAPPSVLISGDYDIVHLSANAGRFLRFTGGEPSRNLIKLVHPELGLDLRAILLAAAQTEQPRETRQLPVTIDGEPRAVKISARPTADGFMLVIFEEVGLVVSADGASSTHVVETPAGEIGLIMRQMEEELQQTKDQLRVTIEQYETSTEELKASNEELQAINEELRSATEELETSKEELQSLNEEMRTVNHELKEKVDELHQANSDLQNLFSASDIGTIFVDRKLLIKRYAPAVQQIFNLIPSDINRPMTHVTHTLEYEDLSEDAAQVLSTLVRVEREVHSTDGRWYIARLLPYRTVGDKIDGVVITFMDITERKLAIDERERLHRELEKKGALLEAVVRQMPAGVIVSEAGSKGILVANDHADRIWREAMGRDNTGEPYAEYLGYHPDGRLYTREEWPMWRSLNRGETVVNEEVMMRRGDGSWGFFCISSAPVHDQNGEIVAGVVTFYDITEEKRANAGL